MGNNRRTIRVCWCAGFLCYLAGGTAAAGTWVADNAGLRHLTVIGIGISPSNPGVIYIQTRSLGIYKTTNGGQVWSKTATFNGDKGPGFDHLLHQGPAVHPTDPNTVWVASGGQVYKTTNGGASWFLSSSGTTLSGICNGVQGVVVDPNDANHLFAGTIISGCDGGVFESTNGGANWTNIAGSLAGGGVGNDAWPIALDASDVSRLYCGSPHNSVYRSIDGGYTWVNSPPVTGDASSYEVVINPLSPNKIWAGAAGGTWLSADYGVTWARQTQSFNNMLIAAIRFAPSNPQVVYAISGNKIWRSLDNGATWTAGPVLLGGARAIEVDPADANVVYVGTWGLGMYKSVDGGQTFMEINTGLPLTSLFYGLQAFAVGDVRYCILSGDVIYRRLPGEANWECYSMSPGDFVRVDRYRPNRWYSAALQGGLWRSVDFGLTWQEIYPETGPTEVFGFWPDPRTCNRIWIGDSDGSKVLRSDDGGDTWTQAGTIPAVPKGFTVFSDLAGDPFDPNVVLAAAWPTYSSNKQHGYVWRSADGGRTWAHVREGMFYGDWRIGDGDWYISNYAMHQRINVYCNYRVNLDHHTFGNGSYRCRMRIISSYNNDPVNWVGFSIRLSDVDSHWGSSGWLVFMRRNGEVALWNQTDKTVLSSVAVADPAQWTTIRLDAWGNQFELFVNETSIGTYTDPNHRWDGPGYFGLVTCKTESDYDDVFIAAETNYADDFGVSVQYPASMGRWLAADAHNPGVFALSTQGAGVWRTADHGATWERITDTAGEGKVNYRPMISSGYSGNIYVCRGSGYSWSIDNFHSQGAVRQKIGQTLSYSSLVLGEDWLNPQRLFAAVYAQGILVYEAGDIIGEPASPIPVRMDFDKDGDVDQADFGRMQACLTGVGVLQMDPLCDRTLLDHDDDTDADDLGIFRDCLSGPGLEPDPACDCSAP
ncbi:MAG TPA: hypothetical protein PLL20_21070 [Phycisphaerae bacterium]|nr:hypothetical protein [Phycisphaerae bacterium]HRR87080.1 hypothetical protein [Phycisphaerae bacterium]